MHARELAAAVQLLIMEKSLKVASLTVTIGIDPARVQGSRYLVVAFFLFYYCVALTDLYIL